MTTSSGEPADDILDDEPDPIQPELPAHLDDEDSVVSDVRGPFDRGIGSLVDEMREELGGPA